MKSLIKKSWFIWGPSPLSARSLFIAQLKKNVSRETSAQSAAKLVKTASRLCRRAGLKSQKSWAQSAPASKSRPAKTSARPTFVYFELDFHKAWLKDVGTLALNLAAAILARQTSPQKAAAQIESALEAALPMPSTTETIAEAEKRRIPIIKLAKYGDLYQLGLGRRSIRTRVTISSKVSLASAQIASAKDLTHKILARHGLPVTKTVAVSGVTEGLHKAKHFRFPIVAKPSSSSTGRGVTVGINSPAELKPALALALKESYDKIALIQDYVEGNDYRIIILGNKIIGAANRIPAHITGDGRSTIAQLISKENRRRAQDPVLKKSLKPIEIDPELKRVLASENFTLASIPPKNKTVFLRRTANIATGGTGTDVRSKIHPQNAQLFRQATRLLGLNVCGLDVLAKDISKPIEKTGGVIIEANSQPGFKSIQYPTRGRSVNIAKIYLESLIPPRTKTRIPIAALLLAPQTSKALAKITHQTNPRGYYQIKNHLLKKTDAAIAELDPRSLYLDGLPYDRHDLLIIDPDFDLPADSASRSTPPQAPPFAAVRRSRTSDPRLAAFLKSRLTPSGRLIKLSSKTPAAQKAQTIFTALKSLLTKNNLAPNSKSK